MLWLILALVAPFLWSLLNHTDKYLISKYSHETGVAGLAIFSSLFAVFALPVIFFFDRSVFGVSFHDGFFLTISGTVYVMAVFFYLHALKRDDASHVMPFCLLMPVFAYILGIIFLGEHIELIKVIGAIITLAGGLILSLEFDEGVRVKTITVLLMVASSICLAGGDVIFKAFTADTPFWQSVFWNQLGFVVFGLILLSIRRYRSDFRKVLKMNSKQLVALNVGGEIIQTVATIINYYAVLLAPVALVLLVNYTFQPLFVFIEGILITRFFPKIAQEHITRKHVIQKVVSMVIMSIGVYLIMI